MKKLILLSMIFLLFLPIAFSTTQEWNSPSGDTWLHHFVVGEEGDFNQGEGSFSQQNLEDASQNIVVCDFDNNITTGNEIAFVSNVDGMIYVYSFNGNLIDFEQTHGDLISNIACMTRDDDNTRYIGGVFEDDANGETANFIIYKMDGLTIENNANASVGMNNVTCRDSLVVDLWRSLAGDDYFFQSCSDGGINLYNFEGTRGYSLNLTSNCQDGFQWGDFDRDNNVEYCCGTMTSGINYVVCRDAVTDAIDYNETYTGTEMSWKFVPQRGGLPYDMITCHDDSNHWSTVTMTAWSFYGKGTQWNVQTRTTDWGAGATNIWECEIEPIDYDNTGLLTLDVAFNYHVFASLKDPESGLSIINEYGNISFENSSLQNNSHWLSLTDNNLLYLWTGDFDGDGFEDDLMARNGTGTAIIIQPGTLFSDAYQWDNFVHGDSQFSSDGVAIADANGDSLWDLIVNQTAFISPFTANRPPEWTTDPGEVYVDIENPVCSGTNRTWTACQTGSCGSHYTNDNVFDNERICLDCESDGIIDSCGAYSDYFSENSCVFGATGVYTTLIYLNDQQNDDQDDWISTTSTTIVWPDSADGCVNTSTGFVNTTQADSYNTTTQGEQDFQNNLDDAWGEIGLGTTLAKTLFWLIIMIAVAVGILFHPQLRGNPMAVYAIGFVEILMLVLGWKLGMVNTGVIVIVTLISLLLLVLMFATKVVGGD